MGIRLTQEHLQVTCAHCKSKGQHFSTKKFSLFSVYAEFGGVDCSVVQVRAKPTRQKEVGVSPSEFRQKAFRSPPLQRQTKFKWQNKDSGIVCSGSPRNVRRTKPGGSHVEMTENHRNCCDCDEISGDWLRLFKSLLRVLVLNKNTKR